MPYNFFWSVQHLKNSSKLLNKQPCLDFLTDCHSSLKYPLSVAKYSACLFLRLPDAESFNLYTLLLSFSHGIQLGQYFQESFILGCLVL